MEIDTTIDKIKKEDSLPPIPISPTTEGMQRLKVMSIGFLCGSDEEQEEQPPVNRRVSDCPYLDLLVDAAVRDAEYQNSSNNKQITVVVNPEIHRDATHRLLLQQQQQQRHVSPSYSNESKADSAVSLSPRLKKEEDDRCWRREMDDELFNKLRDEERAFDEFCDDVSDLSSVNSSFTSDEEEEESSTEDEAVNKKKSIKSAINNHLLCIACSKPLQDISEQVGPDLSITNELATWTWSPSAVFTDWNPKRCPRCERHFTIFKQEWPNRKIKKKRVFNKKLKKNGKKVLKKPSTTSSPKTVIKQEEAPPIIYQMQDDTAQDLNYIPPSPLSEIVHDDDVY